MKDLLPPRLLAIDPLSRGLGIAILEGPRNLVDWGVKDLRGRSEVRTLALVENLINSYKPDVVVLEDTLHPLCRRCCRIRALIESIRSLSESKRILAVQISRAAVYLRLGVHTKYEAAQKVAGVVSDLAPSLPPPRKPWMVEDQRMSIFDAAALALAYYAEEESEYAA